MNISTIDINIIKTIRSEIFIDQILSDKRSTQEFSYCLITAVNKKARRAG
jgi:hypothetical protein